MLPDFKNGASASTEYAYDVNGNMVTDANKNISAINYNFHNKPEDITVTGQGSISYKYDALGNRLQKTITPTSGSPSVYDYIGNFVYKDNQLEYILNDEGRTRAVANATGETKFTYDYFIKDHLGNVRSTINAEPITAGYLAEHEIATYGAEHLVFDNIANVWAPNPNGNPGNLQAAQLIASDPSKRIGTAIMLRTMPGDEFRISAEAYHEGGYAGGPTVSSSDIVSSLVSSLMGGGTYSGIPVSEMPQNMAIVSQMINNPSLAPLLDNVLSQDLDPTAPQAFLTYLMFDQNLQLMPGNSGAVQVPMGDGVVLPWTELTPATLSGDLVVSTEPGYIVIFINNRSIGKDVWFDNIKIEHYAGNVQEENHYYPFGLTLSEAVPGTTAPNNPYKYNTKELEKSFGLEMYDYGARMQDPQIGRWFGVDPLAEKFSYESPYTYGGNNPILNIDVDGKFKYPKNKEREYNNSFPLITSYLKNNYELDVRKSPLAKSTIIKHADNKNFSYSQLFDVIRWDSKNTATPQVIYNDNLFGNAHYNSSSNTVSINSQYATEIEGILASPDIPLEEKQAALMTFFTTLVDETTIAGFKLGDKDRVYEGGTGDAGDAAKEELFFFQPGTTQLDFDTYGETNPIKAGTTIIDNKKKEGKQDLIPTIPVPKQEKL